MNLSPFNPSGPGAAGGADTERQAALQVAARLAAGYTHSELTLRRRMESRGMASGLAREVAAEAARRGWVEDAAVAAMVTRRLQHRGTGRARIAAELRDRGVAEASIDQALEAVDEDVEQAAATGLATRWAQRDRGRPETRLSRLVATLQRRGFRGSSIRRAIAECSLDDSPSSDRSAEDVVAAGEDWRGDTRDWWASPGGGRPRR